jgi:hypothetical protein
MRVASGDHATSYSMLGRNAACNKTRAICGYHADLLSMLGVKSPLE